MGAWLAIHLKDNHSHFELTDCHLLGVTNGIASSNWLITDELQSTLTASGIEWPVLQNHIPCIAHNIQLVFGVFMSTLLVKAAPSLGKPMSTISNLERIQALPLGRVQDFERRATLASTECPLLDQFHQRYLRKSVCQDILKVLKLTIR
jgi:hypothetical protein